MWPADYMPAGGPVSSVITYLDDLMAREEAAVSGVTSNIAWDSIHNS